MQTKETRIIRELRTQLENEGLKPDTPQYDEALRARKVDLCKQGQGVISCWDCAAFDHCNLVKQHLIDLRYGSKGNAP